jgi:hypothetical protein
MWIEKGELEVLYANRSNGGQKVVTVFVGGSETPCRRQCETVLAMDPEIEPPVVVIPFGGLRPDRAEDDDSVAQRMIWQTTPGYARGGFSYRCTRITGMLLVKVLVARSERDVACSRRPYEGSLDMTLN